MFPLVPGALAPSVTKQDTRAERDRRRRFRDAVIDIPFVYTYVGLPRRYGRDERTGSFQCPYRDK